MQNDFAVFILSHGRAHKVVTLKALIDAGYTGKWYVVVDNEDNTIDLYKKLFGEEHVIMFDKQAVYDSIDTMDNFNKHGVIVYARNACYDIAKKLNINYFLELDDDYTAFYRMYDGGDNLIHEHIHDINGVFTEMQNFLVASNADTVAMAQGGDFLGGVENANFKKQVLRKAMNTFFCRTDRPIDFIGTFNEDVNMYTLSGSRGRLCFTVTGLAINQITTQMSSGGMTEAYLDSGTYCKSFYTVMCMPSAVKVDVMNSRHIRIHHKISWDNCVPMILNEKWRKA